MTRLEEIRERSEAATTIQTMTGQKALYGFTRFHEFSAGDIAYLLGRIERLETALQWYAIEGPESSYWSKAKLHLLAQRALQEEDHDKT